MFYFLDPTFWNFPWLIALFIGSFATVIFLRYFLVSILYKIYLERISQTVRNSYRVNAAQIKREIMWAIISTLIFTILCAITWWGYQNNMTKVYLNVSDHSILYFLLSPLIILMLYETYYYWLHRWMHRPKVFKIIHKVHHDSMLPTVFTAFSFHPLEAFLQFIFFPVCLVIMPLHPVILSLVFSFLTLTAMVNHGGVEIYGTRTRHFIGSRHHDLHHKLFKRNFGLNFTWWDKWMKTEKF